MHSLGVAQIISALRGKAPWGVRLGHGSFLTMDFGRVQEEEHPTRFPRGEWHLWLYMCHWRIEAQGNVLAGSEDSREKIQEALGAAVFDEVREIQASPPFFDLTLQFVSGAKILTFSSSTDEEEDQWLLFTPGDMCLGVYGGGKFDYHSANQPRS